MANAEFARNTSRWPLRGIVGSILLLFSAVMAVVFTLQGNRPLLVAVIVLPFAICGLVCLLVKELTALWCGWAFFLSLGLSELDPVGQLLWSGYARFFLTLALVVYTAWVLRDRLWGSSKRRLVAGLWLCGAAVYYPLRWLSGELYGTAIPIPEFCTQGEMSRFQFRHSLGIVLFRILSILFLVLASVALSALFYYGGKLLAKKRS